MKNPNLNLNVLTNMDILETPGMGGAFNIMSPVLFDPDAKRLVGIDSQGAGAMVVDVDTMDRHTYGGSTFSDGKLAGLLPDGSFIVYAWSVYRISFNAVGVGSIVWQEQLGGDYGEIAGVYVDPADGASYCVYSTYDDDFNQLVKCAKISMDGSIAWDNVVDNGNIAALEYITKIGSKIYFGGTKIYSIGTDGGGPSNWSVSLGDEEYSSSLVAECAGDLLISIRGHDVYSVRRYTTGGSQVWSSTTFPHPALIDVVAYPNKIFVNPMLFGFGGIYVLDAGNGDTLKILDSEHFNDYDLQNVKLFGVSDGLYIVSVGGEFFAAINRDNHNLLKFLNISLDSGLPFPPLIVPAENEVFIVNDDVSGIPAVYRLGVEEEEKIPVGISITPKNPSIPYSGNIPFSLVLIFSDDSTELIPADSWSVSDASKGNITPQGLFTALARGVVSVTAQYQNFSDTTQVTVTVDPVGIFITPHDPFIPAYTTIQLAVNMRYTDGSTEVVNAELWEVENTLRAAIDETGLYKARGPGIVRVTAFVGDFMAQVTVTSKILRCDGYYEMPLRR